MILKSGKIEIVAKRIDILNSSETPPFPLSEQAEVSEDVRLRHRYIDLRRPEMLQKLRFRSQITRFLRNYLDDNGFLDIETPILTQSDPRRCARLFGAESYACWRLFSPCRNHHNCLNNCLWCRAWIAIIRLFVVSVMKDLRADRQPEFTQLDVETSFVEEEDLMTMMEDMIRGVFAHSLGESLPNPFPRMTYAEAMARFGSDKPDLRIDLELVEISDLMKSVDFKVFSGPAQDEKGPCSGIKSP